jgi:uncharacterized protein (DUF2252 family)
MNSVVSRILEFNKSREPERRALKYAAMRRDPFTFFRGTAHLFYHDWPTGSPLDEMPLAWSCGDLHLENFGCYKASNGLAYFDINDFDEAGLAPAGRDLARFATSSLLAADQLHFSAGHARAAWIHAQQSYSHSLTVGKAMWFERATAVGVVKRLLRHIKHRTRAMLLDGRTERVDGKRRFQLNNGHALPVPRKERQSITKLLAATPIWREDPSYFRILDIVRRIAGTGSLGLRRWAILVNGYGGSYGQVLLDLKEAAPSAMLPIPSVTQPKWTSEAERVVTIQKRFQAASPALLHAMKMGSDSYILRELQPVEDRLTLEQPPRHKALHYEDGLASMAEILAWDQLRSCGRQGSASADEMVEFGRSMARTQGVLDYAREYVTVVRRDWKEFSRAFDDGAFGKASLKLPGTGKRAKPGP